MTVSSTSGTEISVDTILTTGLQLSGVLDSGQPADEADLALGRILLDTQLDELQTEGVYARSVDFIEVGPLTVGEPFYSLPSNVLDLIGDGAYIDTTNASTKNASGETPVKPMDRQEWQRLSSKDSEGRPYKYYLHRAAVPLQVRLWPRPDEAATIRFQAQLLMADTFDGSSTVDLRQFWVQYLIWEMAHQFSVAKTLSPNRSSMLFKRAKEKKERARAFANQHVDNYVYLNHPSPWRGR